MVDVFLCYAAADREIAAAIAGRLESAAEARVVPDEIGPGGGQHLAANWEAGLGCDAVVLLWSPEAAPSGGGRQVWGALLDHVTRNADPPVAHVLVRPCAYPPLLERKRFCRWASDPAAVLRSLQCWTIGLHPSPAPPGAALAGVPWFAGRESELAALTAALGDHAATAIVTGAAGSGRTTLAHEFAHRAAPLFREVIWVACREQPPAAVAAELAAQLGVSPEGPLTEAWDRLRDHIGRHRVLVVLDDFDPGALTLPRSGGSASVLITLAAHAVPPCDLPVIELGAPRPASGISLPHDPAALRLWRALSLCQKDAAHLDFAAALAGLEENAAREAARLLTSGHAGYPVDEAGLRYRLVRRAPEEEVEPLRRAHAMLLLEAFSRWTAQPATCGRLVAESLAAIRWAVRHDWATATQLGRRLAAFLQAQRRELETCDLLRDLRDAATARADAATAFSCARELSWLLGIEEHPLAPVPAAEQLAFEFGEPAA